MEGVDILDGVQYGKKVFVLVGVDFLFVYFIVVGYYFWRNFFNGLWFIQFVVKVLRENVDYMDFFKMLIRVNFMVFEFELCFYIFMFKNKRQIFCIVLMLRKDFYFFFEKFGYIELIN